jgi:hypothetical protein
MRAAQDTEELIDSYLSFADTDSDEDECIPTSYDSPDSSEEELTPKENSSLNDEIGKQHHQQFALVATQTKHKLTFNMKNTSITSYPDTLEVLLIMTYVKIQHQKLPLQQMMSMKILSEIHLIHILR